MTKLERMDTATSTKIPTPEELLFPEEKRLSEEDALTELAIAMVNLAKDDYVKGALILIKKYAKPMELIIKDPHAVTFIEKSRPGSSSSLERKVYWYKDATRFINNDPYGIFGDPSEVIRNWNKEAWRIYRNKMAS